MARFVMEGYRRKSMRRPDHDYARGNTYFITIRTEARTRLFGHLDIDGLHINDAGRMVMKEWVALAQRFDSAFPGVMIVMPDHIHGILVLEGQPIDPREDGQRQALRPTLNGEGEPEDSTAPAVQRQQGLPCVMQAFKSLTTKRYCAGVRELGWPEFDGKLWQRSYYDRIVRSNSELDAEVEYIRQNPKRLWEAVYKEQISK